MGIILSEIYTDENIQDALIQLRDRKNTYGADGLKISELPEFWTLNGEDIIQSIHLGKYTPGIVQKREIVNSKGKRRGIVTINSCDRLLLHVLTQCISEYVQPILSEHLYSYRKGMGCREAASCAAEYIESGKTWVAEIDVKNYFDSIPIDRLISKLARIIEDKEVVKLVERFLSCQVDDDGELVFLKTGLLQGSPISPVLSNIYLSDLDKYLDDNYCFFRYGDNINIYCENYEDAIRARHIVKDRLADEELMVHEKKGGIFLGKTRQCLGYEFYEKDDHIYVTRSSSHRRNIYNRWHNSSVQRINKEYHLINEGVLTRKDFTLLFENEEGKHYIPVEAVESINVYSNITISSGFLEYANSEHLQISFVDKAGENIGTFIPATARRNLNIEAEQILLLKNEAEHLELARRLQKANVFNLRAILRYYARRGADSIISDTIELMSRIIKQMDESANLNSLMIYEAQARQKYYKCFNSILRDEGFLFIQRTRRPPRDPINALISFGNTLLYQRFAHRINMSALDIRFGIVHNSSQRSESLNLDLADLFKPVLVDRTIFTLVNKGMINAFSDFREVENGGIYLSNDGKRTFIEEFENKLAQKVKYNRERCSYDDLISREIKKLEKFFRNHEVYKPYKYVN